MYNLGTSSHSPVPGQSFMDHPVRIYFTPRSASLIRKIHRHESKVPWSAYVNRLVSSVDDLCRTYAPELSDNEHQLLQFLVSSRDYMNSNESLFPLNLAAMVMRHYNAVDLDDVSPEVAGLVRRLKSMTQIEQFSLLHTLALGMDGNTAQERLS